MAEVSENQLQTLGWLFFLFFALKFFLFLQQLGSHFCVWWGKQLRVGGHKCSLDWNLQVHFAHFFSVLKEEMFASGCPSISLLWYIGQLHLFQTCTVQAVQTFFTPKLSIRFFPLLQTVLFQYSKPGDLMKTVSCW